MTIFVINDSEFEMTNPTVAEMCNLVHAELSINGDDLISNDADEVTTYNDIFTTLLTGDNPEVYDFFGNTFYFE